MSKNPRKRRRDGKSKRGRSAEAKSEQENGSCQIRESYDVLRPFTIPQVAPELWRNSWLDLRQQFQHARETLGSFRCLLLQSSIEDRKQVTELMDKRRYSAAPDRLCGTLHPIPVCRDEMGYPVYKDVPVHRDLYVFGRPVPRNQEEAESSLAPDLAALFSYGGKNLLSSPLDPGSWFQLITSWLPREVYYTNHDTNRFPWTIFELAWTGRHPALKAERRTWYTPNAETGGAAPVDIPYDCNQIADLRAAQAPNSEVPELWMVRLPSYFFSELPDLFTASVNAIDYLLSLGADDSAMRVKPNVPPIEELTDRQRSIWDELKGQARTAKQLSLKIGLKSPELVIQEIAKMRKKGFLIKRRRGLGYYRTDAPLE